MKCFPNNKPYITKEIKDCIHRKKLAFARKDRQEVKWVQKEFNTKLREEKRYYKDKTEKHFNCMNNKTLWDTMKSAINMNCTMKPMHTTNEQAFADEINYFYRHFDTQDSSSRCDSVLSDVFVSNADRLEIDIDVVTKVVQHICSRKATGPDGISVFLLETFAEELAPAWCPIFQLSVDSHMVPILLENLIYYSCTKEHLPKRKQ